MRGDEQAASEHFAMALALSPADANWRHELVVGQLHALGKSGQLDEAIDFAEDERRTWVQSPDFHFVLGDVLLDCAMADPENAIEHWLPHACASWDVPGDRRAARAGRQRARPGQSSGAAQPRFVRSQLAMLAA